MTIFAENVTIFCLTFDHFCSKFDYFSYSNFTILSMSRKKTKNPPCSGKIPVSLMTRRRRWRRMRRMNSFLYSTILRPLFSNGSINYFTAQWADSGRSLHLRHARFSGRNCPLCWSKQGCCRLAHVSSSSWRRNSSGLACQIIQTLTPPYDTLALFFGPTPRPSWNGKNLPIFIWRHATTRLFLDPGRPRGQNLLRMMDRNALAQW